MAAAIHFFSHARDAIQYLSQEVRKEDFLTESRRLIVPSALIKARLLGELPGTHIQVQTLRDYAIDVVISSGHAPYFASPFLNLIIKDLSKVLHTQKHPDVQVLYRQLEQYEDAYDGLVETVRILIASGLNHEIIAAMYDALEDAQTSIDDAVLSRARAVLGVTELLYRVLESGLLVLGFKNDDSFNIGLKEGLYVQASNLLHKRGGGREQAREESIYFYGFSDLTGLQLQLVETIIRYTHTAHFLVVNVYDWSQSPPPKDASQILSTNLIEGKIFTHLNRHYHEVPLRNPKLSMSVGLSPQTELRGVLSNIHGLLQAGESPDNIVLLTPNWEFYAPFLRTEMSRLNIPFTLNKSIACTTHKNRRMGLLLSFLAKGAEIELTQLVNIFAMDMIKEELKNHFIELDDSQEKIIQNPGLLNVDLVLIEDIQLFIEAFGLRTLEDIATKKDILDAAFLKAGMSIDIPALVQMKWKSQRERGVYNARRRKLPTEFLRHFFQRCIDLRSLQKNYPKVYNTSKAESCLLQLWKVLGWSALSDEVIAFHGAIARIEQFLKGYTSCSYDDFLGLLAKELQYFGKGIIECESDLKGIEVINITDSSGLYAPHIFLMGLNKGAIPGEFISDPLLPNEVRTILKKVTPSLRDRSDAYIEERHRLYQLIGNGENVHLSWCLSDALGKALSPSPLVRRLLLQSQKDPELFDVLYPQDQHGGPRSYWEHGIGGGLYNRSKSFQNAFQLHGRRIWRELFPEYNDVDAHTHCHAAVRGRLQVASALYSSFQAPKSLGPYDGMTGFGPHAAWLEHDDDGRPRVLSLDQNSYITHVESYFSCPWRFYLQRLLRLEYTQPPHLQLPQIRAYTLGNIVHNTLEDLIKSHDPLPSLKNIAQRLPSTGFSVSWSELDVQRFAYLRSSTEMHNDQQLWPQAGRLSSLICDEYLAIERALEFMQPVQCLGAELEGEAHMLVHETGGVPCTPQLSHLDIWASSQQDIAVRILFKADRVDIDQETKSLHIIDYKTGAILSKAKQASTRKNDLLKKMKGGEKLQPIAYVASIDTYKEKWPDLQTTKGSLVYLKPHASPTLEGRVFSLDDKNQKALSILGKNLWTNSVGQAMGVFFPRIVKKGWSAFTENSWCKSCDYQSACRMGDSGFRRRLITVCENLKEDPLEADQKDSSTERIQNWRALLTRKVWDIGKSG